MEAAIIEVLDFLEAFDTVGSIASDLLARIINWRHSIVVVPLLPEWVGPGGDMG